MNLNYSAQSLTLQLVFGALFTLFGFLIVLSLLLTSVDKALNSLGPKTGYVLVNSTLPNPVDTVLVYAQRVFPLDYVVYSGMVLFFMLRFVVVRTLDD